MPDDADDEIQEERLASDPYANVFFSKDRIEKVIEPIEREEFGLIPSPSTPKVEETVQILGRGAWMSGCPEGSEYRRYRYKSGSKG